MHHRVVSFIFCCTLLMGSLFCSPLLAAEKESAEPFTVVTFGDSTTATRGPLVVYSMILEKELPQQSIPVKVINAGIGGNTTANAVARFEKDVLQKQPDLVVIQFGINDSAVDVWRDPPKEKSRVSKKQYEANLRSLIKQLKEKQIAVILMTPNSLRWIPRIQKLYGKPPYDPEDPDGFNLFLKAYAETVRQIAKETNVPLVDVYAAFETYAKQPGQSAHDLLLDGIHPNTKGQRMVADLLMPQIKQVLAARKK
ncbi:SGNH/GDSL hydrolase family protein [Gimesia fumaroli]|uniref:Arylesterase n=1 Tax=Gimesia fumaroli TaxID=2527976 RepID=A0A518I4S7_9PLAN|nr:SGNH/GDSL hydrolase family protein [Gimesia fumaroli]QDV48038.1 Arylesterase precursor [Gimesia fumaroli]